MYLLLSGKSVAFLSWRMARRSLIIRKARMAFLAIVIIASADVCDSEMRFTLTAS